MREVVRNDRDEDVAEEEFAFAWCTINDLCVIPGGIANNFGTSKL